MPILTKSQAKPEHIRAAYHSLSRRYHPDKQPPALRERATEFFNQIQLAYETLCDPSARVVYDELGLEGLKEQKWNVGMKSMSPAEFKIWLQENIKKSRRGELDELVTSTGKVSVMVDLSGIWYMNSVPVQDANGNIVGRRFVPIPIGMSNFTAKHGFAIPLHALGDAINAPLPTTLNPWSSKVNKEVPLDKKRLEQSQPMLRLDFGIGGKPVRAKGYAGIHILGNPSLAATMSHDFPNLPPDAPRSVASLLGGNQIQATFIALPTPVLTTSVAHPFGQNMLVTKATFAQLPTITPPILELQLQRQLGLRHSFLIGLHTGSPIQLSDLLSIFSPPPPGSRPRNGYMSISYTYHPLALPTTSQDDDEDDPKPPKHAPDRSKRTETYTAAVSGGLMAGGTQLTLNYGRTFYMGATIGDAQRKSYPKPNEVGIRLGAQAVIGYQGEAVWTIKATRKVFNHTSLGLSLTVGGDNGHGGVSVGVVWSRLGQSISVPVIFAPAFDSDAVFYGTAVPLTAYVLGELLWFRPRDRVLREREREEYKKSRAAHTIKHRNQAANAVELMRTSVLRKTEAEMQANGLVIRHATFGPEGKKAKYAIDVTIPLQALVDNGQLVVPKGVDKVCPNDDRFG